MFISKKTRTAVYSYLFKEGTICAKKDFHQLKHSEDLPFPNLEVLKLLVSFKSKGYVRETFNWQWYYWYLTDEGIDYLRKYLGLPDEIVPATLKQRAEESRPSRPLDGERRPRYEDGDKKGAGPGGDFKPKFQSEGGGFGRGYNRDSYRRAPA